MAPFDETPETDDDVDFPDSIDLGALLGGAAAAQEPEEPEGDKLATDSLDALRDEETGAEEPAIDPARAAIIEATGEDDEDDDIEDLEELERDGFGGEREYGFDSIDDEEEDDYDEDYD